MKLSSIIAGFALSVVVSATPLLSSSGHVGRFTTRNEKASGAVFFLTNEKEGNFVVGSDIGSDGKLTPRGVVWAGGNGAHGRADGSDALFSQSSIRVSGKHVFAVNPGSNTVSMFAIDPEDPAKLSMVGQPARSGGDFPVSLAVSKQSGNVCVLNGGKVNGIKCFKQDADKGLTQLDNTKRSLNLTLTNPPLGPTGTVSHVLFSEDGKRLFASVKGIPPDPGFIATWDVDQKTGALSETFEKSISAGGGFFPFGMSKILGKDAVLAADPGSGFDIFRFNGTKYATSTVIPISNQKAVARTSFSRKTGNFYLTDLDTSVITEVHVDNNLKGSVVKQYPQANGSALLDNTIASIGKTDFMYALAAGKQSVLVFKLNRPGDAQFIQEVRFAELVKKTGIKTDAKNLQGIAAFVAP